MRRATPPTWQETFRAAGAGLLSVLSATGGRVATVSSARSGEGRTTTCAGVAAALAQTGRRVVAVDLDLRHPALHQRLGTADGPGASELLRGVKDLAECLQQVSATSVAAAGRPSTLRVLPAGEPPPDPAELLEPGALRGLLAELASDSDLVLIDTPPLLDYADGLFVGGCTSGALVVVRERRTPATAVDEVRKALVGSGVPPLGLVFHRERR